MSSEIPANARQRPRYTAARWIHGVANDEGAKEHAESEPLTMHLGEALDL